MCSTYKEIAVLGPCQILPFKNMPHLNEHLPGPLFLSFSLLPPLRGVMGAGIPWICRKTLGIVTMGT